MRHQYPWLVLQELSDASGREQEGFLILSSGINGKPKISVHTKYDHCKKKAYMRVLKLLFQIVHLHGYFLLSFARIFLAH